MRPSEGSAIVVEAEMCAITGEMGIASEGWIRGGGMCKSVCPKSNVCAGGQCM